MEGFAAVATMVMINVAMALPAQAVDVKKGYIFGGLTNKLGVLGTVEKKRKKEKGQKGVTYLYANTIAFATFDESPWTTMIRPAITVIEQPTYAIGQTAAEMLLKRIAEPNRPTRQVVLSHKLIIRQSCGCPKT